MNADGSDQRRLTRNLDIDLDPAWSPNGRSMAFTTNRAGNYEIYVMNADGSGQTRVTNNPSIDAQPDWQPVAADTTPPILSLPSDIVTNATGPAGATVTYTASAADAVDGPVQVACTPASGTIFPIGTTVVTCTATDTHGNASNGSFNVHVKGADEQLDDLLELVVTESLGPGNSFSDKLRHAQDALAAGDQTATCEHLDAFRNQVQAQFGKKLTPAEATELVDAANRIQAVLDC